MPSQESTTLAPVPEDAVPGPVAPQDDLPTPIMLAPALEDAGPVAPQDDLLATIMVTPAPEDAGPAASTSTSALKSSPVRSFCHF
jgi:hypothetical protein